MERRRRSSFAQPGRSVKQTALRQPAPDQLPYLSKFIEYGKIAIGEMAPVGGVAIASEGRHVYVMLRRRNGENLHELMIRLDQAIGKAVNELVFTDEINTPL